MNPDLDKLKNELPAELEKRGFVVFRGVSRADEENSVINWDTVGHPGHENFLDCASKLGAKVIVFHTREFEQSSLDDLHDELEAADLPPTERRELERRLKALKPYTGFTANLEMSFDFSGNIYLYEIRSEFMNELLNIMSEIDTGFYPGGDFGDEPDEPAGGFFSRN